MTPLGTVNKVTRPGSGQRSKFFLVLFDEEHPYGYAISEKPIAPLPLYPGYA